jgi:serine/threonine-protein kinase
VKDPGTVKPVDPLTVPPPVAEVDAGAEAADDDEVVGLPDLPEAPDSGEPKPVKVRPPPAKPGMLSLQTTPWTIVYFGKKSLGETPLANVKLPPGRHRLRLVNEEKKLSTTVEVEIKSGQTTTMRLKL